jgi:hypothetical protein
MVSAITPLGVSDVVQLQLIELQPAVVAALQAHPQSTFHGEIVIESPASEHEQLMGAQVTLTFPSESSWMTYDFEAL